MKQEGTRGAEQKLAQRNNGGHGSPRPRIKNVIPASLRGPRPVRFRNARHAGSVSEADND